MLVLIVPFCPRQIIVTYCLIFCTFAIEQINDDEMMRSVARLNGIWLSVAEVNCRPVNCRRTLAAFTNINAASKLC